MSAQPLGRQRSHNAKCDFFTTSRELSCLVNGSGHLLPSRNKWMGLNRKFSCISPPVWGLLLLGWSQVIFSSVMPIWCYRTEYWSSRISKGAFPLLNCLTLEIPEARARWITFWNEFTVVRGMSAFALSHSLICAIRCWKSKHCPTSQWRNCHICRPSSSPFSSGIQGVAPNFYPRFWPQIVSKRCTEITSEISIHIHILNLALFLSTLHNP